MKIKSIQFENHKILGNLYVNFCDESGHPVDTIIIAGENGTGKSTLLNVLYKIGTHEADCNMKVLCECQGKELQLNYHKEIRDGNIHYFVGYNGKNVLLYQTNNTLTSDLKFSAIYSDVDINFKANPIKNVSSLNVDTTEESRKSDSNLTQKINQLIVDIQALDDAELAAKIRSQKGKTVMVDDVLTSDRMGRFLNAFDYMFSDLKYESVENISDHKEILFNRDGVKIPLDQLSSGEKQIVYRGLSLIHI